MFALDERLVSRLLAPVDTPRPLAAHLSTATPFLLRASPDAPLPPVARRPFVVIRREPSRRIWSPPSLTALDPADASTRARGPLCIPAGRARAQGIHNPSLLPCPNCEGHIYSCPPTMASLPQELSQSCGSTSARRTSTTTTTNPTKALPLVLRL
ncbi:hypothetical protein K458DRAFT_88696 [Lentithecium fluviatile CBS 122367]|uniref:Uncharacterized protein n=1 Tax=Lentithecium fluviatile CBS 122367 TaxID=1168545 RepID=A0A6G1IRY3_9PLEO|nr:hypothetical protein K458DRAFT_88696 [Lentithecium fluviatile CBS 122367]